MQPTSPPTSRVPASVRRILAGPWGTALAAWAVARVCLAMGFVVSDLVANHLQASPAKRLVLDQGLITWDGPYYWNIAHGGYHAVAHDGLRFFPLYPLVGRVLGWPIGGHEGFTLVLVSNLCALLALVLLHRLVVDVLDDDAVARRAMWCTALFPAGAVFAFAYTESLALVLTLAALVLAHRRRWAWAALAALGCGLARPVGVLVALPLAAEAWHQWRAARTPVDDSRSPNVGLMAAAVAAPAVGLVAFLAWIDAEFGSWRIPLDEQRKLRGAFQDPVTRVWDALHLTLTSSRRDVFNLAFAVLLVCLLVVLVRRFDWGWWTFAAANLAVALSSHVIDSVGRYGMMAFPFMVALALVLKHRDSAVIWLTVSAGGLVAMTTLHLIGGSVP
jgi:hypothetical protein